MIASSDRATCTHPDILPDVTVTIEFPKMEERGIVRVRRIEECRVCGAQFWQSIPFSLEQLRYYAEKAGDAWSVETQRETARRLAREMGRMMPHTPKHPD